MYYGCGENLDNEEGTAGVDEGSMDEKIKAKGKSAYVGRRRADQDRREQGRTGESRAGQGRKGKAQKGMVWIESFCCIK